VVKCGKINVKFGFTALLMDYINAP
jgi:hypothetical protein